MATTFACPQGHQWEDTWGDADSMAAGTVLCPVCGAEMRLTAPAMPSGATARASVGGPAPSLQKPDGEAPSQTLAADDIPTIPPQMLSEKVAVPGYEILGELGRGGMGVVYKARQTSLKRMVALKMVLAGAHASKTGLARFRSEAEAVARLQHPNIVQIYEISEHDGRPFFSMEYVDGGSLSSRTASTPQPAEDTAKLMAQLARAMHSAHEAGIVHRDLKPANVLLKGSRLKAEGFGVPKITDFGLAKQMDDTSQLSQTGDVMGTPSYMAPEQAAGKIKEIGPAADIWALGAVLFEMLTGRPPFKAESPMDTLLQVLYSEPVPPSYLRAKLPADLQTICLKCLEKDIRRRYPTALALAEDLERFLEGRPITARPISTFARTVKWTRRHPAVAALLAVIFLAGTGLLAASAYLNVHLNDLAEQREKLRKTADDNAIKAEKSAAEAKKNAETAEQERDKAVDAKKAEETQRKEAEANFQKARDAVNQMLTEVSENDLFAMPSMENVRAELLQKALKFHEGFQAQKGSDPKVRQQTGLALQQVGDIYALMGNYRVAEAKYRDAIALFTKLKDEKPAEPAYAADLADSYFHLGQLYRTRGMLSEAESSYLEARKLQFELSRTQKEPRYRKRLAEIYNDLALVLLRTKRVIEATKAYDDALALQDQLVKEVADDPDYKKDLAGSHNDKGKLLRARALQDRANQTNLLIDADKEYQAARELFDGLASKYPQKPEYRLRLGVTYNNLANVQRDQTVTALALASVDKAQALLAQLTKDFRSTPRYRYELANAHNVRAAIYKVSEPTPRDKDPMDVQEKYRKALQLAEAEQRKAVDILRDLNADYPGVPDYQSTLAATMDNLADVLAKQDRVKEARDELAKSAELHVAARKKNDKDEAYLQAQRNHFLNLANVSLRFNKTDKADPATAAQAAARLPGFFPDDPEQYRLAAILLARCVTAGKQDSRADQWGKQAVQMLRDWGARKALTQQEVSAVKELAPLTDRTDYKAFLDKLPQK